MTGIETARLDVDRLAHRLVDAETDTVCTHFDQFMSAPIPGADQQDADRESPPVAPPLADASRHRRYSEGLAGIGMIDRDLKQRGAVLLDRVAASALGCAPMDDWTANPSIRPYRQYWWSTRGVRPVDPSIPI